MLQKKETITLIFILLVTAFLRFFNLMHDAPYFFDPDERNMANAISQFRLPANLSEIPTCIINQFSQNSTANDQRPTTNCNLNPHFFAYGQFPLYLSFVSDQITKPFIQSVNNLPAGKAGQQSTINNFLSSSFPSAIFWLRFYSALTSVLTVLMVYLITKKILMTNDQLPIAAALMAALTPGLIQAAHFGTTESFLTFFFLTSIYISLRYLNDLGNLKFILLISLTIGLSLGSKLTGVFFFVPPTISLMLQISELFKKKHKKIVNSLLSYLVTLSLILIGSIAFFVLSSPYNLVEPDNFKSAVFGYESDVATGRYEAFYTRQFVNTTPILFQAEKTFPYALGWPVFILGTLGFLILTAQLILKYSLIIGKKLQITNYKLQKNGKTNNSEIYNSLIILTLPFIIYFLPNAFLFAKWTRFMTPIFPFFAAFAAFALLKLKNLFGYRFIGLLVFISILPGIAFMSIYQNKDTRVQASEWIYDNIPANSYVLSETANVVDIPLGLPNNLNTGTKNYEVISFNFYNLDEDPALFTQLINHLEKANYIFIPSRRIFADYPKIPQKYPLVTKYYQLLFSGALGYEKIMELNSFPRLGPWKFPDEEAEETFTVFDHPVIRIYSKIHQYTQDQYRSLLTTARID